MTRFWKKVNKTNHCWLWTGAKDHDQYGRFRVGDEMKAAHRISWELCYGGIPDNFHVLHRCDNPACVNPDHLFLGTHQDNMKDKQNKHRLPQQKGNSNNNAKLTEDQVKEIREKYSDRKTPLKEIALLYGVTRHTIGDILLGKLWKHIK